METISRYFEEPAGSYFLLGPRGTGKSTWVRGAYPEALIVDLLDPATYRAIQARPERLAERVTAEPQRLVVVIDEVQRVPDVLHVVHQLIEQDRNRRFVLTGSSARKLRRGGVNLLGGRAALRHLHPFMAVELGSRFSLDDALSTGMVPIVRDALNPVDARDGYASLYVREEVQAEGIVRNIGAFARFLEAVSFSHACPINIANVARECEVGRKTVEGYVSILEDLLLAFRLEVFTRRSKRATTAHSKLFLFDTGIYRSLRPSGPLDQVSEIEGAAFEGLVAQHLRAWIDYGGGDDHLFFWRTRGGSEVDFVVYGQSGFWAIEVKNTARLRPSDFHGLRAFSQDYPEARLLLVYRGSERILRDGVLCIPVDDFLLQVQPRHPLDHGL